MYLYSAAETLGVDRTELLEQLHSGKAKYSSIFNYPTLTWADIGAIGWLVDGAAIMNQTALAKGSYGPYSRAMVRICKEESFHNRQGYEIMCSLAFGSEEQKQMAQDALNRWWWPAVMMLGPSDDNSPNTAELMRWKVKIESNDSIRERFIDRTVPQAEFIGLKVPDPELTFDKETGHYKHGPINWKEFFDVIKGNGPCNKIRMNARIEADRNGKWVREAAEAHTLKMKNEK